MLFERYDGRQLRLVHRPAAEDQLAALAGADKVSRAPRADDALSPLSGPESRPRFGRIVPPGAP